MRAPVAGQLELDFDHVEARIDASVLSPAELFELALIGFGEQAADDDWHGAEMYATVAFGILRRAMELGIVRRIEP